MVVREAVGAHSLRMTRRCQAGGVRLGWGWCNSFDKCEMRGAAVTEIGCERVGWDEVRVAQKSTGGGGSGTSFGVVMAPDGRSDGMIGLTIVKCRKRLITLDNR